MKRIKLLSLFAATILFGCILFAVNAKAATYTVTSTADNGVGSLRAAIATANSTVIDDTINFQIPADDANCTMEGICTITLTTGDLVINSVLTAGKITITNSTGAKNLLISGNNTSLVFNLRNNSNTTLDGVNITKGNGYSTYEKTTLYGAGIYVIASKLLIKNSIISNNTVKKDSGRNGGIVGGIYSVGAELTVINSSINNNSGDFGGIFSGGGGSSVSITNSIINNNTAYYAGGGIYTTLIPITIYNSTITDNVSEGDGGGIYCEGRQFLLNNSTVSNNTAARGGGFYFSSPSPATITNSTISGNNAMSGGGIWISGGTFNFTGTTITKNSSTSTSVGAIYTGGTYINSFSNTTVNLNDTIIAGNIVANSANAPDLQGAVSSNSSYNLIGNNQGLTGISNGSNGNQIGTSTNPIDPRLAPLADNGGLTKTHALFGDSPAIDKGKSFNLSTDQRDAARPYDLPNYPGAISGDEADIGAFEISPIQTPNGDDVNVPIAPGKMTVSFSQVTNPGTTGFFPISLSAAGAMPSDYSPVANELAYDITTTATYTAPVTVCFTVSSISNRYDFARLRVLHGENGQLVDRTVLSPNTPAPDYASRKICARVSSLSPFVVAQIANNMAAAGTIIYGNTSVGQPIKTVSGVTLNVTGTSEHSLTNDSAGFYQFSNLIKEGNYTITPSKIGGISGITSFDATLVLRCVAAGADNCTLTGNQKIAADTNNSNTVTAFDATQILRFVAANGQTSNTGQTGNWKFNPGSRTYMSLIQPFSNENYEAILVGDVNGSWEL